jgi:hypothetical protein
MNCFLFLSFIVQAVTACIILSQLKIPYMRMVFELHELNGVLFIALALTHIVLNWGWVKANFFAPARAPRM